MFSLVGFLLVAALTSPAVLSTYEFTGLIEEIAQNGNTDLAKAAISPLGVSCFPEKQRPGAINDIATNRLCNFLIEDKPILGLKPVKFNICEAFVEWNGYNWKTHQHSNAPMGWSRPSWAADNDIFCVTDVTIS